MANTIFSKRFIDTLQRSAESPGSFEDSHRVSHLIYAAMELGEALARIEKKLDQQFVKDSK